MPILDHSSLNTSQHAHLRDYFHDSVRPIITPLAVDAEHPFPFVSNLGLNLAVLVSDGFAKKERFVRIKVPNNRPRWVPLADEQGFVPLEQVIAANLDLLFGGVAPSAIYFFRVTRGATGDARREEADFLQEPGAIIRLVARDLKARRFAGVVRVKVDHRMPIELQQWLAQQFGVESHDVYPTSTFLGIDDLMKFAVGNSASHQYQPVAPVTHPRLKQLDRRNPGAIFDEIRQGDILLHHPYHSFDTSVQHLLDCAARDPQVLAIKLTIYRTSQAGVPISLNDRGLRTLVPGVPGLSGNITVFSVVGRFLEHSRTYRFVNGSDPAHYIGSADWMKRNLNRRVETVFPVLDPQVKRQLDEIFNVYEKSNLLTWDCQPDGRYVQRRPGEGEPARSAQRQFIELAKTSRSHADALIETTATDAAEGTLPP